MNTVQYCNLKAYEDYLNKYVLSMKAIYHPNKI